MFVVVCVVCCLLLFVDRVGRCLFACVCLFVDVVAIWCGDVLVCGCCVMLVCDVVVCC